ncbi:DUF4178 domain-containing protein [Dyadobacter subterraneus]|uniref:DUF4178 domain-containing protein n=1 Tax=Dyadobacter subterraneus TaxID=2773304 RepID=A0ABR9WDU1_9BACT|nr:DUF4178 domain-containing protein [Dyadobacter subterraneus]MBE9463578.1 DUF4178 domain-containing protein [Dyadobacter subterraneus]
MENTNNIHSCPSCGETIDFKSTVNNLAVCTCGLVWERDGENLSASDTLTIKNAADFIQSGTTGSWNNLPFTVTGRFRLWFEQAVYNYWSVDMGDEKIRYLAEGYGMFAIYEPASYIRPINHNDYNIFSTARQFTTPDNEHYEVTDKDSADYIDVEGSVFKPAHTKPIKSIEAVSINGRIEIIQFSKNTVMAFKSHPVSFEDLNFQNLREKTGEGKTFACRNCNTKKVIETYPYAQSWVCDHCETRLSVSDGMLVQAHGVNKSTSPIIHVPIGSDIELQNVNYRVIGFSHKQDSASKYDKWKEYTLYNKYLGYAFLTESDGHWMLLKETQQAPLPSVASLNYFSFEDKTFNRFLTYKFDILYSTGEFPGNIFDDHEEIQAIDFISPPEILSIEKESGNRNVWFRGEYIERNVIKNQVSGSIPSSYGVAPAQPKNWADTGTIVQSALIVMVIMLLTQYFINMNHLEKTVLDENYKLADSVASNTFMTEKFVLKKWKSNLLLKLYAPVDNSWFEFNITLVNVKDGSEYNMEEGLELYKGYSDGEFWSEGSAYGDAYFSSIPAGTYFMSVTGTRDSKTMYNNRPYIFNVKVINDTPMYRNFILILLCIITWPIISGIRNYNNERQRWSNSPYSTFNDD